MTAGPVFTSAEWDEILASPMLAGMVVTLADPSGLYGAMHEGTANARALVEARSEADCGALAQAVAEELGTSAGRSSVRAFIIANMTASDPSERKAQALAVLDRVNNMVTAKAPDAAPAFRAWLKGIAMDAAEACREGGFLGFGGTKVSEAEHAAMAELDRALG